MSESLGPMQGDSKRVRILRELVLHAVGWAVTFGLLWVVLGLGRVDFRYPMALFAQGDGVYYAAQVKILLETGWVYHHPDLGAPFGLYLYDFAHFDALHLLVMKLIGYAVADWAVVLNVYYLLTFLLSTTTALALFRHLSFRAPLAMSLALLFSFQPYHFDRGQGHIMLAGYYHLPLLAFALLWLLRPGGLRDGERVSLWRSRRFWVAGVFAFLGVFAGHYYTAFACMGYLVAATYSSLRFRRWAPLIEAGLLFSIIGVGFVLNLLPNMLYWAREGGNRAVSAKSVHWVEVHSLRPVRMLLPIGNHRFAPLAELSAKYDSKTPFKDSEGSTPIGLVAGAGVLALIAVGLFGATRGEGLLRGLGTVTLVVMLFTSMSGFGAVLAYTVTPQFHGLNRASIYLAMLGLLAVGLLVSRFLESTRRPLIWSGVVLACGGVGLIDILPAKRLYDPPAINAQFLASRRFGGSIQKAVPEGTLIYQLPSSTFPFGSYGYIVPYLYTKGLRWTEPAMRNRRAALLHETIEALPAEAFLEQLALLGVGGIVLDVRAKTSPLVNAVQEHLLGPAGLRPVESGEGASFFDLRDYLAGVRRRYTDEQLESLRRVSLLQIRWKPEFYPLERGDSDPKWYSWRWCTGSRGTVEFFNYHNSPMRVALSLKLEGVDPTKGFTLSSALLPEGELHFDGNAVVEKTLLVPPGEHRFTITYWGERPLQTPIGSLWFRVESFQTRVADEVSARPPR